MWEVRANPRGTGGGRLISPLSLASSWHSLLVVSLIFLGPDPVNEIIAEIFAVDTRSLWPCLWLQQRACLSLSAHLVWMENAKILQKSSTVLVCSQHWFETQQCEEHSDFPVDLCGQSHVRVQLQGSSQKKLHSQKGSFNCR